jgi:hypothetical protein
MRRRCRGRPPADDRSSNDTINSVDTSDDEDKERNS